MNQKANFLIVLFWLFIGVAFGQIDQYDYQRKVNGVENEWHPLILPDDIFGHLSPRMGDIRVYGLTAKKDTISASFVLLKGAQRSNVNIGFNRLNASHNTNGYYYTFELLNVQTINEISLDFAKSDFDWKVQLAGSQDQKEWFTILDDYRILSMHQNGANFEYTQLKLPESNYRYYRLLVKDVQNPGSMKAFLSKNVMEKVTHNTYKQKGTHTKINKEKKQTVIDVELNQSVPVSALKIDVKSQFSFHRPISVLYAKDSLKNEKGWQYHYVRLTSDMLHDKVNNELRFGNTILRKLKIIIDNQDNPPLDIGNIEVKGQPIKMLIRFTEPAEYYLVYGQKNDRPPSFDISDDALPAYWSATELTLGPEQVIKKAEKATTKPLFENKIWLWVVMGAIILLLGWFSLSMMKER